MASGCKFSNFQEKKIGGMLTLNLNDAKSFSSYYKYGVFIKKVKQKHYKHI